MKVAITGATGGLGRSTVEYLMSRGFTVIALGRNTSVGAQLVAQLGCEFRAGSLDDVAYLRSAFEGCTAVVHCAGLASPVGEWSAFEAANVTGTANVLEAALKLPSEVRTFIHISTPSVYFDGRDRVDISEEFLPEKQSSLYGRSKLMADELVLKAAAAAPSKSFVLLRPRAIIGPYDQTILPRIFRLMLRGKVPMPGGGRALIDLTAVKNVAHAIELALKSERVFHGEIFNITNEEPVTLLSLMDKLSAAVGLYPRLISIPMFILKPAAVVSEWLAFGGREPLISEYAVQSIGTSQVLSTKKARELLNYRPIVSLEDALREVVKTLKTKV